MNPNNHKIDADDRSVFDVLNEQKYKCIGVGIIIVAVLLFFVNSLSEVEANYKCSGTISKNGNSRAVATMHIQLKHYGLLKQTWTGNDGKFSFGGSSETMDSYSNLSITGNKVSISSNEGSELGSGVSYGTFSTITNTFSFYIDYEGEFEGNCINID